MKTIHEDVVLKPKDPSIADSNAWLEYPITHVEVTDPETGELTSLLTANVTKPLTITGKLDRLPDDLLQYVFSNAPYPCNLQITNVRTFSYGQYEEGTLALWAAGNAGWFELKPSRRYKEIWAHMLEAVEVLYFLTDAHRDLKKKELANITLQTILERYAEDPKHGCTTIAETQDVIRKHRAFLLAEMTKENEGVTWSKTQTMKRIKRMVKEMRKDEDVTMTMLDDTVLDNTTIVQDSGTPSSETPDSQSAQLRPAGKGKSSLRPISAKIALKAEGRRQSTMDSITTDVSMTAFDNMESTISTPSASLSMPIEERNNKRRATADRRAERLTKRQKLEEQTQKDAIIEVPHEQQTEAGADIPLPLKMTPSMPAPRIRPRPQKKPTHQVHIIEEALPSFHATGDDGVWRCSFDGCSHTVYGVTEDNEDSKLLIKEHYKKHAIDSQAKLDLIYKEERPYLPVGNLVKRIRELAAAKQAAEAAKGETNGMNGMNGYPQIKTEHRLMDYPQPIVKAGY